jgi:hypothetical protein
MSISERRLEGRFLCADLVRVTWGEGSGGEKGGCAAALLEDISALGACVQLECGQVGCGHVGCGHVEQPIPLGAPIELSFGETRFRGSVCYSVYREYGQFVGIRFSGDTEWSADVVLPLHLTNLEILGLRGECTAG